MPTSPICLVKTPKIQDRRASECIFTDALMHSLARRACMAVLSLPLNSGMNLVLSWSRCWPKRICQLLGYCAVCSSTGYSIVEAVWLEVQRRKHRELVDLCVSIHIYEVTDPNNWFWMSRKVVSGSSDQNLTKNNFVGDDRSHFVT